MSDPLKNISKHKTYNVISHCLTLSKLRFEELRTNTKTTTVCWLLVWDCSNTATIWNGTQQLSEGVFFVYVLIQIYARY